MSRPPAADTAAPEPPLFRGLLLYFLPLPLIPAAVIALFAGEPVLALSRAAGFAASIAAATLIRRGLRWERETARRNLRRRATPLPYRLLGAGVLSAGVFQLAWLGIGPLYGIVESLMMAGAVFAGCYLYYGFDPARRDPEVAAVGITTEELVTLLAEAERRIVSIETAARSIRNFEFRERLRRIAGGARGILDTLERDPVDARRARKFLKVYLDGAQQVVEGYARRHAHETSAELDDNFRRVLTTIETVIEEQQTKLRVQNADDLDVKIEVLQLQLEKEGVA